MSVQRRRRGQPAIVYPTRIVTDNRDNVHEEVALDSPIHVTAAFIPQRSARAELPGQAEIDVVRMICDPDLPDVSLWSRVFWRSEWWDIVTPPSYRHGTRHVRHWSIDLRRRP